MYLVGIIKNKIAEIIDSEVRNMKLKIKQLERKDFGKVVDFAIKVMNFNRYVDNPIALLFYGRYFLYLELERTSQVISAYMEDQLVGILMADIKNEPKQYSSFWRKLYVKLFKVIMAVVVRGGADTYDEANKDMF